MQTTQLKDQFATIPMPEIRRPRFIAGTADDEYDQAQSGRYSPLCCRAILPIESYAFLSQAQSGRYSPLCCRDRGGRGADAEFIQRLTVGLTRLHLCCRDRGGRGADEGALCLSCWDSRHATPYLITDLSWSNSLSAPNRHQPDPSSAVGTGGGREGGRGPCACPADSLVTHLLDPSSPDNPIPIQTDNLFSNEEEFYTSFEQAISNRITMLNRRRNSSSYLLPYAPQNQPLPSSQPQSLQSSQPQSFTNQQYIILTNPSFLNTWQQTILIICLALILLMLGFDLMGLLILLMH